MYYEKTIAELVRTGHKDIALSYSLLVISYYENLCSLVISIHKSSVSVGEVKEIVKIKLTYFKHNNYKPASIQSTFMGTETSCPHKLFAYEMFLKLSIGDVINKVRDLGLCLYDGQYFRSSCLGKFSTPRRMMSLPHQVLIHQHWL